MNYLMVFLACLMATVVANLIGYAILKWITRGEGEALQRAAFRAGFAIGIQRRDEIMDSKEPVGIALDRVLRLEENRYFPKES